MCIARQFARVKMCSKGHATEGLIRSVYVNEVSYGNQYTRECLRRSVYVNELSYEIYRRRPYTFGVCE